MAFELFPVVQWFDNAGNPLAGGLISTFVAGTTTPQATFTDSTGGTPQANPVVLDSAGRAQIWFSPASYKLVLKTSAGATLMTIDNVTLDNLAAAISSLSMTGNLTMQQSTAATAGANQSSNIYSLQGTYWNGSASAIDQWQFQNVLGAGANPTSTLQISHSGSPGTAAVNFAPPLTFNNLTLGGTTAMTGSATIAGNLSVTGNQTIGGTLGATGRTTLASLLANSTQVADASTTIAAAYAAGPANGVKVVLGSDLTISAAQTVAITNGKPLYLDLNGRVITMNHTTGAGLTFTKVDNDVRYTCVIENGTINYTGASAGVTGVVLGGVALPFTNAFLGKLTIQNFSTAGSIGLDEFFCEEVAHNVVNFNNCAIGLQTEVNTINCQYANVYWQRNAINFKIIDSLSLSFIDCLPQSASNVRANQIIASTGNVSHIYFENCWFENNGDATNNSRQLYIQAAAAKAISRITVIGCHFNQGTNTPVGSTIFEFAGPGTLAYPFFMHNAYAINNVQTGFTNGIGITVINDGFPVYDTGICANGADATGIFGLSFAPATGAKKYSVYAGSPGVGNDGSFLIKDLGAAVFAALYGSSTWTYPQGTAIYSNGGTLTGFSDNQVTTKWILSNVTGKLTNYAGSTTAGNGVASVLGSTTQKAETAADTNILTFTPPAAVGTYRISFVLSLSAATAATLGWTATWKDSNAAAQAPTNLSLVQSGAAAPALTFTTSAAGNYYGSAVIDVDASATAIVVKLTFAGTSFAGKVSATVERVI